jgi:hypothetical protein
MGVGRKADGPCCVKKKIIVVKSKEVKTGSNLAESSKEGYGSKGGCFANADTNKHCPDGLCHVLQRLRNIPLGAVHAMTNVTWNGI